MAQATCVANAVAARRWASALESSSLLAPTVDLRVVPAERNRQTKGQMPVEATR